MKAGCSGTRPAWSGHRSSIRANRSLSVAARFEKLDAMFLGCIGFSLTADGVRLSGRPQYVPGYAPPSASTFCPVM